MIMMTTENTTLRKPARKKRHMEASYISIIVQESKNPLRAGDKQERTDTASCHRTDTSDYYDQQDLIGHGRLEHGCLDGSLIHGK